jgi:hypothetical protein
LTFGPAPALTSHTTRLLTDDWLDHPALPYPDAIPSRNRVAEFNSDSLSRAVVGKTIAGLVVGNIEVYADGAIYDTANNRFLSPGSFAVDPAVFHRSGLS